MNMLMVTGMISNPENRRLFIKKMSASENVSELRIIRAKQVQDQFGPGLPEEQAKDDMDRQAMQSKTCAVQVARGQRHIHCPSGGAIYRELLIIVVPIA